MSTKKCVKIVFRPELTIYAKQYGPETHIYVDKLHLVSFSSMEEASKTFHQLNVLKLLLSHCPGMELKSSSQVKTEGLAAISFNYFRVDANGEDAEEIVRIIHTLSLIHI